VAVPNVSLVLLRGMLPDVPLTPGTLVSGRVLDAKTLVLQGVRLQAQLPEGVVPGQRLRMRVEESSGERLHLRVVDQPAPGQAASPSAPTAGSELAYVLTLPGGVTVRLLVDPDEEPDQARGAAARRSVVVRYDSPTLGRMDVRLDAAASTAAVHVAAGQPADRVRGAADVLRDALSRVSGAPVQVTVHPRNDTLDVRA
jgi:hypothetical protein